MPDVCCLFLNSYFMQICVVHLIPNDSRERGIGARKLLSDPRLVEAHLREDGRPNLVGRASGAERQSADQLTVAEQAAAQVSVADGLRSIAGQCAGADHCLQHPTGVEGDTVAQVSIQQRQGDRLLGGVPIVLRSLFVWSDSVYLCTEYGSIELTLALENPQPAKLQAVPIGRTRWLSNAVSMVLCGNGNPGATCRRYEHDNSMLIHIKYQHICVDIIRARSLKTNNIFTTLRRV